MFHQPQQHFVVIYICCLLFILASLWTVTRQAQNGVGSLADVVTVEGVLRHLNQLEKIALNHPNKSRSVANGHKQSAEYVMHQLKAQTSCNMTKQYFVSPIWKSVSARMSLSQPFELELQDQADFNVMRYGGQSSQLRNAKVQALSKSGCKIEDFDGVKGKLVLLENKKLECTLFEASYNAELSGAVGVLWYNTQEQTQLSNGRVRLELWKEGDPLMRIPVLSISHAIGVGMLVAGDEVEVNLETVTEIYTTQTFNVICETLEGDPEQIAFIGAHLDSVDVYGDTGMNDNGSGSSAALEVFLQLYATGKYKSLRNKVRFAWWSAEEDGLLGSRYYARLLKQNQDEYKKVVVYGNHDMAGSQNLVQFVYDGSSAPESCRKGSIKMQQLYEEFFNTLPNGHPFKGVYELMPMYGGSDFFSFLEIGTPASGLATGAGAPKTIEQRHKFGGSVSPYDSCYHKSCDTIENINTYALEINAKAIAFVTEKLGFMKDFKKQFK